MLGIEPSNVSCKFEDLKEGDAFSSVVRQKTETGDEERNCFYIKIRNHDFPNIPLNPMAARLDTGEIYPFDLTDKVYLVPFLSLMIHTEK